MGDIPFKNKQSSPIYISFLLLHSLALWTFYSYTLFVYCTDTYIVCSRSVGSIGMRLQRRLYEIIMSSFFATWCRRIFVDLLLTSPNTLKVTQTLDKLWFLLTLISLISPKIKVVFISNVLRGGGGKLGNLNKQDLGSMRGNQKGIWLHPSNSNFLISIRL